MRILFPLLPGKSHLHGVVPLLRALEKRGHELLLVSSKSFVKTIEHAGFQGIAAGKDWIESEAWRIRDELVVDKIPRPGFMISHVFPSAFESMTDDLRALTAKQKPDAVVRAAIDYGPAIFAEYLGVPDIAAGPSQHPRPPPHSWDELATWCTHYRETLGLTPDPNFIRHRPEMSLLQLPPCMWDDDEAPNTLHFRPEPYQVAARPTELAPERFRGDRPLVHVTLGTALTRVPPQPLVRAIVEAAAGQPYDVLFHWEGSEFPFDKPDNVRLTGYVAHAALLPQCDAIVTHGGMSTILASIELTTPMVVTPIAVDQPANAAKLERHGLAAVVRSTDWNADAVRSAIARVLDDKQARARLASERTRAEALPDIAVGVEKLEEFVAKRASAGAR